MRVLLLCLTLALAGCDLFSGGPEATFTAAVVRPNVELSLKNTGDTAIEVGPLPCAVDLDIETDGGWEDSGVEPLITCLDVLTVLDPGETEVATYSMKGVPNGLYRFRVTVSEADGGSTRELVSNEIRVASAAS